MRSLRPIRERDLDGVHALLREHRRALTGMISLPQTRPELARRIEQSSAAVARAAHVHFAPDPPALARAGAVDHILFVLVDGDSPLGVTGVTIDGGTPLPVLRVTLDDTSTVLALRLLVEEPVRVELGATFLAPAARGTGAGALLSKGRLLWLSQLARDLPPRLLSHIRGRIGADGTSPLWEMLGASTLGMGAVEALASARRLGRARLLAPLVGSTVPLAAAIEAEVGQPHEASLPARRLLAAEGLEPNGMFDPFDGGPTIETRLDRTAVVTSAARACVASAVMTASTAALVARPSVTDFEVVSTEIAAAGSGATAVPAEARHHLGVDIGSEVLVSERRRPGREVEAHARHRGAA